MQKAGNAKKQVILGFFKSFYSKYLIVQTFYPTFDTINTKRIIYLQKPLIMLTLILIPFAFVIGFFIGKGAALKEATKYLKDSTKIKTKRKEWKS
jgi:uncharacterized membrane protein YjgN (DUF898 family)